MGDESKTETEGKGILAQVREERELLAKEREDTEKLLKELKELKSEEILSGRAPANVPAVKPKLSDAEYYKQAKSGTIPKD